MSVQELFASPCSRSVLMSAGRYEEALEAYADEPGLLASLPLGHPDRALLHRHERILSYSFIYSVSHSVIQSFLCAIVP